MYPAQLFRSVNRQFYWNYLVGVHYHMIMVSQSELSIHSDHGIHFHKIYFHSCQ